MCFPCILIRVIYELSLVLNSTNQNTRCQDQRRIQQQEQGQAEGAGVAPEIAKAQGEQMKWSQELERSVIEHGVRLKQVQEEHALKLSMAAQKAAQDRAIADAKAAAEIQRQRLLQ